MLFVGVGGWEKVGRAKRAEFYFEKKKTGVETPQSFMKFNQDAEIMLQTCHRIIEKDPPIGEKKKTNSTKIDSVWDQSLLICRPCVELTISPYFVSSAEEIGSADLPNCDEEDNYRPCIGAFRTKARSLNMDAQLRINHLLIAMPVPTFLVMAAARGSL